MKKILITVLTFLSLHTFASNDVSLILEYNYAKEESQISLKHLETDNEFCCYFDIVKTADTKLKEDIIKVIDKKTGVCLGIIYGVPDKNFLMHVYSDYLTPEKVEDITSKLEDIKN